MEIFLSIFIILCMFIIGSLFGSFFSLATYRIPRHQDIVIKQSYCPNCKHKLGFFDLFPVLSYLFCGGKCRYCKNEISPRYIFLEMFNGVIFVFFYLIFGYTINLIIVAICYAFLFVIIGSHIMKSKMTKDELENIAKEIEKNKKKKNDKLSKKSGVFVTEIIIAVFLFLILMVTSFGIVRNSNVINSKNIVKSNGNIVAVKNMEVCLATSYDELSSYNLEETVNGTTYDVNVTVKKESDVDFSKEDLVKTVEVKVTYMYNGVEEEIILNSVKGKVL